MRVLIGLSWGVTLTATVAATLLLVFGMPAARAAPQEATIAALACAIVIIPYVFTRSLEGFRAG